MRLKLVAVLGILLLASSAGAQQAAPKFKSIEITHFTQAEGVEVSPEFPDFLYATLKKEFKETGLFEQVIGENENVDAADASRSLILQGTLLEDSRRGSSRARVVVRRRNSPGAVFDQEVKVRSTPELLAPRLANKIAKEVAKELGR